MKLRNKKTGEIKTAYVQVIVENNHPAKPLKYDTQLSLAELNEEWEDYDNEELPKGYWVIEPYGKVEYIKLDRHWSKDLYCQFKDFGNCFETKEEAEKALEKLKAWKRLTDRGFRFTGWDRHPDFPGDYRVTASDEWSCDDKDLDLLFGGEE